MCFHIQLRDKWMERILKRMQDASGNFEWIASVAVPRFQKLAVVHQHGLFVFANVAVAAAVPGRKTMRLLWPLGLLVPRQTVPE
jgi:hypothetical protein